MNAAAPPDEDIVTEKAAFADLVSWAKDRPRWQQDGLRRLVQNDALTESDFDELAEDFALIQSRHFSLSLKHMLLPGALAATSRIVAPRKSDRRQRACARPKA